MPNNTFDAHQHDANERIVSAVLAALKQTDVWRWAKSVMEQQAQEGDQGDMQDLDGADSDLGFEEDDGLDDLEDEDDFDLEDDEDMDDDLSGLEAADIDFHRAESQMAREQPVRAGRRQYARNGRKYDPHYSVDGVHGLDVAQSKVGEPWREMNVPGGPSAGMVRSPNRRPRPGTPASEAARVAEEMARRWAAREDTSAVSKQRAKDQLAGRDDDYYAEDGYAQDAE
jgi:hypothetical protein